MSLLMGRSSVSFKATLTTEPYEAYHTGINKKLYSPVVNRLLQEGTLAREISAQTKFEPGKIDFLSHPTEDVYEFWAVKVDEKDKEHPYNATLSKNGKIGTLLEIPASILDNPDIPVREKAALFVKAFRKANCKLTKD